MNKTLKLLIGGLISALGLYLAFKGEDFDELILQIQQVHLAAILIACALLVLSCLVRAYRWQLIMDPVEHIPLHPVFSATMVGYFGNGILAFRLGELLRAYSVASKRQLTVSQAFGTVILERILDVVMVLAVFVLTIPWFPFEHDWIRFGVYIFSGITLIIVLMIFMASKFRWMDKVGELPLFQTGIGEKLHSALDRIFDGITIIIKTNHAGQIILSGIILWAFYFLVTYIVLNACGLDIGYIGTGILLVLGSVAIAIPALPGSAGTYDAGVKYSLMVVFGIAGDQALTYAIVSHAVSYFPLVLVGAIYFLLGSVRIKDVHPEQVA